MSNINELAIQARTDTAAMLSLWLSVERLIGMWAGAYMKNRDTRLFDEDDLKQAGFIALVDAITGYDPDKGAFTTWLRYHIRDAFNEVAGVRTKKRAPELTAVSLDAPTADDLTLADTIPDNEAEAAFDTVIEDVYRAELQRDLDTCLDRLPDIQADILRGVYYKRIPIKDLAEKRGISAAAVINVKQAALRALRYGKNRARLAAYRDDIISRSYRRGGHKLFRLTGSSSVEWAALKLINAEERTHCKGIS